MVAPTRDFCFCNSLKMPPRPLILHKVSLYSTEPLPFGRGGGVADGEGKTRESPLSPAPRELSPRRAYDKFIVGEGSPLPKRDRILCFIHGRRNASPTRQIFVSSYAIGVCGNGYSRHKGRGSSRTAGATHKKNFPKLSFLCGTGAWGIFDRMIH